MDQTSVAANDANPVVPGPRMLTLNLDGDGLPRSMPIESWWNAIDRLISSSINWRDWPESHRAFVRMTLRFTRSDGSSVFEPAQARPERLALIRSLADSGMATIVKWWSNTRSRTGSLGPPPLPAFGSKSKAIAVLRADWAMNGDFLALDARDPASPLIDLTIGGLPLLGPAWPAADGKARMRLWQTSSTADIAEWSNGAGDAQSTRTAIFLRGRRIAILGEERTYKEPGPRSFEVATPTGVTSKFVPDCRSMILKAGPKGTAARAIPIPLDRSAGSFALDDRMLSMKFDGPAGRSWTPLLISWDADRNRRPLKWRLLTVSEQGKACKPSAAFAARVSWGLNDTLVIYRSLVRPTSRTFLGHQTSARFLVGTFNQEGNVTPILTLD